MTRLFGIAALFALAGASVQAATPLGDGFTYQGRLTDNNAPANGLYDLSFTMFDAATGPGTLFLDPLQLEDVPVENGVFTVQLDFGSGYFNGQQRWLEIGVRDGVSVGAFDLLAGRQELTAAPYAQYARQVNPRVVIPSITSLSGAINSISAGGGNAPWVFAGPTATVSVGIGQRITAEAVGSLATGTPGVLLAYAAMCTQPAAGGTLTTMNGGNGVAEYFPDGVGQYRQLTGSQTKLAAAAGSFKVGLCIRNTSGTGLNLSGDSVSGWVMVSN